MQVTQPSIKTLSDTYEDKGESQKRLVEELRGQWKLLWSERFNDKVRAEDVSANDYAPLHVDRGTIIHATRDYKPLNFKDILEQNKVENPDRFVQPDARLGGWNKFVKTNITGHAFKGNKRALSYTPPKRQVQQVKKGGRGWLHVT